MSTMNNEFFDALILLEQEKGVPADYLLEKMQNLMILKSLQKVMLKLKQAKK